MMTLYEVIIWITLSIYDKNKWLLPSGIHSVSYGGTFIKLGESYVRHPQNDKIKPVNDVQNSQYVIQYSYCSKNEIHMSYFVLYTFLLSSYASSKTKMHVVIPT